MTALEWLHEEPKIVQTLNEQNQAQLETKTLILTESYISRFYRQFLINPFNCLLS